MSGYDVARVLISSFMVFGVASCLYLVAHQVWLGVRPQGVDRLTKVETPVGRFAKYGNVWVTHGLNGTHLSLTVNDWNGDPDPAFLEGVPDLLVALEEYEGCARLLVPELREGEFVLVEIHQGDGSCEVTLVFERVDPYDDLRYIVEFVSGRPTRYFMEN